MAAAVRGSSVVGGSGVTSLATGSFTSATGDTIGVWFNYGVSTDPTSVTDNKGNTFTQRGKVSRAGGFTAFLYTCENAAGGAGHIVTLNIGFTEYPTLAAVAIQGVQTSSVLDVLTTNGVDTVQPWELSSGTLSQADEIVFGFLGSDSGSSTSSFTEGSGMTKLGQVTDSNLYWTGALAYVVVAATTARVQSWVSSVAGDNSTQIVASFRASGGGGGPTTTTATSAAGVATVSGAGASSAATAGSAAGAATVAASGASTAVSTATAAGGSATVSAVGAAVIVTTATAAAGVATVSAAGSSTAATGGQAAGVASVSGAGASTAQTAGSATGTATVSGAGASTAATTATPAAGSATVSAVGSSVAAGQTTAIPAEGVATVSAQGSSVVTTTAVPAQGSSEVSATTPTTGGGGYDSKAKVRKRVNELNKKILQAEAEAQEITQVAVTKAKSVKKSADQGFDEDEEDELMLLL